MQDIVSVLSIPEIEGSLKLTLGGAPKSDLIGRSIEREAIRAVLDGAREGLGGALVLRGEAGIGKTTLLDDAVESALAQGMQIARLTGFESETQFGFAALHRLLLPYSEYFGQLPAPLSAALESTFGLVEGPPPAQFLVALAVLTLVADLAIDRPLLCAVDDGQWIDPESGTVVDFVARRLRSERVAMLMATRDTQPATPSGMPELLVGGLSEPEATDMLFSITQGSVSGFVADRLVAITAGNPLALVELTTELSKAQLSGASPLPEPLPIGHSLQQLYSRRINRLPPDTRLLLALAASEPNAAPSVLWQAAERLGIDPAAAADEAEDLVNFTSELVFRHPLMRSAAYHLTPLAQRRLIHEVLADLEESDDPDRAAWHLGMAAVGPDDAVADRQEQAAEHARERGGYAATVTFLSRAVELSVDESQRIRRLIATAQAALIAGQPDRARSLLDQAQAGPKTELQVGTILQLYGTISVATGQLADATPQLLAAARTLMPLDSMLGRQTLLQALEAAGYSGRHAVEDALAVANEILPNTSTRTAPASVTDALLFGFHHRFADQYSEAVPLLRRAVNDLLEGDLDEQIRLQWLEVGCYAASELFDDEARTAVAAVFAQLARKGGALTALPMALTFVGESLARVGRFDLADAAHAEGREISAATRNPGIPGHADPPELLMLCWRGRGVEARSAGDAIIADMVGRGVGVGVSYVHTWLTVLENGLGNYHDAFIHARYVYDEDPPALGCVVLPELIEAASRCGESEFAEQALERLAHRAQASGSTWGLGLLARARAFVADGADADRLHQESLRLLGRTRAIPDLARSHLVYGEWLRRQRRRRDARHHLRIAYETLADIGAGAFAKRARIELEATGEHARERRNDRAEAALTPQETHVAQLVSQGLTNAGIAAQLFISPSTVDYHLRKVFQKLDVKSRTQLARKMGEKASGGSLNAEVDRS